MRVSSGGYVCAVVHVRGAHARRVSRLVSLCHCSQVALPITRAIRIVWSRPLINMPLQSVHFLEKPEISISFSLEKSGNSLMEFFSKLGKFKKNIVFFFIILLLYFIILLLHAKIFFHQINIFC